MPHIATKQPDGLELHVHTVPGAERIRAIVNGSEWGLYTPSKDEWYHTTPAFLEEAADVKEWVRKELRAFNQIRRAGVHCWNIVSTVVNRRLPDFRTWSLYKVRGTDWHDIYVDDRLFASYEVLEKIHVHPFGAPVWLDEERRTAGELVTGCEQWKIERAKP